MSEPRTERLQMRVRASSSAAWRLRAAAERLSLSDWLHRLADRECGIVEPCPVCGRRHDGECE